MTGRKRSHRMRWAVLTVTCAMLPLGILAGPQGRGPRGSGPGDPGARLERLSERLGLSEEQRARLEESFALQREATAPLMEQKRGARVALHDAIHAATFDEGAIRAAATRVAEIDVELAVTRARHRQQLREILDDEQLARLDAMRERRGFGRGPHRGRPGEFGPGPASDDDF